MSLVIAGSSAGIQQLNRVNAAAEREKQKKMLRGLPKTVMPYDLREGLISEMGVLNILPDSPARKFEGVVQKVKKISKDWENEFRNSRFLPQYRHLTRPVYKACVEYIGPVAATAVSFLSADLIVHQLIPQAGICLASYALSEENTCSMHWYPWLTASWMAMAVPVMYAKYQK